MLTDDELIERIQSGESDQVEFTESVTEKRHWQQLPYDMHGVGGASIENDIDMENFTRDYLPNAVSAEVLQENERNPEEQMQSLRLITRENIPTVTAILMLGKDTRYWFPGAYIQFVRFDGNEVTNMPKNQSEVRSTLSEQMKNMDFMKQFGRGITKARKLLKANGNPPVEFNIQDNFIFATVTKKP